MTAPVEFAPPPKPPSSDRPWHLKMWDGMGTGTWLRLLARNRFAVTPSRIPMSVTIGVFSPFNTVMGALQQAVLGRKIARTEITEAPLFIVGHWRSGTTLLHEYLVRDPRHTSPTTFQCFAPHHFLLTHRVLPPLLKLFVPNRRPMDNMEVGMSTPQEDEFALCNMGVPSPYLKIIFPRRDPPYTEYLDFAGLPREEIERWKASLLWFLKAVTCCEPKRIVLKSPPHTARIGVLREMFPDARFVHIVRNPYTIFPSTVNLWRRLAEVEGLQHPPEHGMEEHVFDTFNRMYAAFERDRPGIPPGHFAEVRYEELVQNPLSEVERIYHELDLGEFDAVRPALEAFVASQAEYRTNRFQISPELRARIDQHWGDFIRRYGYAE